jgi:tetratricopeptide (TPR) repeat protein
MDLLMNVPNMNRGKDGYTVVEMDDLLPFWKEANDLMALGRYAEAEKIYRPHVLPEMLGKWTTWWGLPHDMAVNYGLCLDHLGRAIEAEKLFLVLAKNDSKPAVFYVNYSMTLNLLNKGRQADDLCREGLKHFPNDIDIQGNLTIALIQAGEYERAFDSALKRLKIRRDVHSIDEAANVLLEYATATQYADLPRAMELIRTMGDLIKEGLRLNPNYHILRLKELFLRSLVQDAHAVNTIAPSLWESELVPLDIRKEALIKMLEHWSENGWGTDEGADSVLQFIKNHSGWLSVIPKLKEIELRTIARYKMMRGKTKVAEGVVIPEIDDYFLRKKSSVFFPDPILAAQLKDWLGYTKEALDILTNYLADMPDDFNAIRLMATVHCNNGNFVDALKSAHLLVKVAPWRTESYDCLAYVAERARDVSLQKQAKDKADIVFSEEIRLYEEMRAYLNQA